MLLAARAPRSLAFGRASMLPRLLGSGPAPQDGSSKLLELTDRDGDTEQPTPSSQGLQQPDEDEPMPDAAQDAALASVITQVQSREQQQGLPPAAAVQYAGGGGDDEGAEGGEVRSNWKNKFRCAPAGRARPVGGACATATARLARRAADSSARCRPHRPPAPPRRALLPAPAPAATQEHLLLPGAQPERAVRAAGRGPGGDTAHRAAAAAVGGAGAGAAAGAGPGQEDAGAGPGWVLLRGCCWDAAGMLLGCCVWQAVSA